MSDKIEIEDIKRLNVRPGEALLVTLPNGITAGEAAYYRDLFAGQLPGFKILIRTADVGVEVVSAERAIGDAVAEATANPGQVVEVKE